MSGQKKGRPTNNPLPHKISIRINDDSQEILNTYCFKENVTKTEAIERGIKKLVDDLEK